MDVCYNGLFKLLIDKGLKKTEFAKKVGISANTLAKLSRNEMVSMEMLVRICRKMECTLDDIVEILPETILKNKCYNFIKKNKKLSLVESEQVFEQSSEICNLLESQLIKEEAGAFLNTLIRGLKYPYKEVIYLQYYDGKVLESKKITQAKKIKIKKKTKIFI